MLDTFIRKTVNRAFKCENIDVTIPEMVDLIQYKILNEASDDDLTALRKGMYKTWALAIGGASNDRYYPSFYRSVRLCFRFSYITHQLKEISLQDIDNNKEYFIPGGKESCNKLQRAVLRRLEQYTGDEVETRRRPGQRGKFQSQKQSPSPLKWLGIGSLGIAAAVTVLMVALKLPSIGGWLDGSDTPEWVSTVQNGYLGEYTDITVYELLSTYRAAARAEKQLEKANIHALQKKAEVEHPTNNPLSRWRQKQAIKRQYAAQKAGRSTVEGSVRAAKEAAKKSEQLPAL